MRKTMDGVLVFLLSLVFFTSNGQGQEIIKGKALPAWQPGYLDLHHINTGRGNAAYFVFPDGTTMLVDAGELDPTAERTTSARNTIIRPNNSKPPFEWIADYIRAFAPQGTMPQLDYALITHFHDDHFGSWYPAAPWSKDHRFQLTGITGVAERIPIGTLLTRDFHYPVPPETILRKLPEDHHYVKTWSNYKAFVADITAKGTRNEYLRAGSATQIRLLHHPESYPAFSIRNIKSNGLIWTGNDSSVQQHFKDVDTLNPATWPDENPLSNAIVISYGGFKYYTGGDNPGNVFLGDSAWRDVESEMAPVIGSVDAATMDHHGNRDAVNASLVETLQPRVWVEQVWTADHPGHEVLIRIMSSLYNGPRDLFSTNMLEANKLVIGPLVDKAYKSQQGHVLIRVLPGGKSYYVIILNDEDTRRNVKAVFGPYEVKNKYTTSNAHAHNDYEHERPFASAYEAQFGSMEADIFLHNNALIVGHTTADIAKGRTLESLYLEPLQQQVKLNKGYPYADTSRHLQLMIDLKTNGDSTLDKLVEVLKKYTLLTASDHIHFVITGNRPAPEKFASYPAFVWFDGEFQKSYPPSALNRIVLFSDNLKTYTKWNGKDKMSASDEQRIDSLIQFAHSRNKKIRFWNAPDFPEAWKRFMGFNVDYINTDHIKEISGFLSGTKTEN